VKLAKGGDRQVAPVARLQVPVLSQLLAALGPSPLWLLSAPAAGSTPVSGVWIHEPRAALPPARHALLLAVGARPSSPEAAQLLREAARAGYTGLVIKSYGEPAGPLAAVAEETGLALLAADEDLAWHHLDALISAALAAVARPAAGGGATPVGDLFALANAIAAMVGGATAIEDPYLHVLAYSTLPGQAIDEHRRQGILGLQVPYVPVNEAQYRELGRAAGVCRFTAGPGSLPRLAIAVRAGAELLGSIWVVDADGTLEPGAEQALTEAASIAALHLLAARTAADLARRLRGDLLRRVLAEPASAAVVAPQLGLSTAAPVAVAAFTALSADPGGALAARAALRFTDLVSLHCEAHYGRPGCALIDGTVYALLPAHSAGAQPAGAQPDRRGHRELVTTIARRAQQALRLPVRAALGGQVAGLALAAASRRDADLVLRVLASRPDPDLDADAAAGPLTASIDEVRASATLADLAQDLNGRPALGEGAGPAIRAHDTERGTSYAATLLSYLDANSDIAEAARQLNVHPNTCRYRLARAEQLFGFSLADPDERLLLWLQLRLASSSLPAIHTELRA
jgi:PucR C-terminal helix-turn-helix domain/GGDEF-like domain